MGSELEIATFSEFVFGRTVSRQLPYISETSSAGLRLRRLKNR